MAQRVRDLEAERALLIDRLLVAAGARPLRQQPVTAAEIVSKDTEPQPPVKNRRTPSDIAAMCTAAKTREAQAIQTAKQGPPPPPRESTHA